MIHTHFCNPLLRWTRNRNRNWAALPRATACSKSAEFRDHLFLIPGWTPVGCHRNTQMEPPTSSLKSEIFTYCKLVNYGKIYHTGWAITCSQATHYYSTYCTNHLRIHQVMQWLVLRASSQNTWAERNDPQFEVHGVHVWKRRKFLWDLFWDQFNSSAGRVELVEKHFGWAATGQLPDSQCHSAWAHQRLGWLSDHGILLDVGQWLQAVEHSTTIGVVGLLGVGMILKILLILGYSSVPDLSKLQFSSRISNYIIDRYFTINRSLITIHSCWTSHQKSITSSSLQSHHVEALTSRGRAPWSLTDLPPGAAPDKTLGCWDSMWGSPVGVGAPNVSMTYKFMVYFWNGEPHLCLSLLD